jgi:chromodomain-helicase-DNA-binding protein 4
MIWDMRSVRGTLNRKFTPINDCVATWDSPPRPDDPNFATFEAAFHKYISARQVVPTKKPAAFDKRPRNEYKKKYALGEGQQPELGQDASLKLMPFQVRLFAYATCTNQSCSTDRRPQLAMQQLVELTTLYSCRRDGFGVLKLYLNKRDLTVGNQGKTVQIATFLGTLIERWQAFPALVVVPNSTITNWIREFERWAPGLRVVPFYGEVSRAINSDQQLLMWLFRPRHVRSSDNLSCETPEIIMSS